MIAVLMAAVAHCCCPAFQDRMRKAPNSKFKVVSTKCISLLHNHKVEPL
jgi:hypothetical protein